MAEKVIQFLADRMLRLHPGAHFALFRSERQETRQEPRTLRNATSRDEAAVANATVRYRYDIPFHEIR